MPGTGFMPRCSRSLRAYSASSPACRRLAMMLSSPSWAIESAMNRRAGSSNSIRSARSSVVRVTRETSETTMMPAMNTRGDGDAVRLLDDVGDQRVQQDQGEHREADGGAALAGAGAAEMVTATAPETIIARMPVAYAPAWALTSAPEGDRDADADRGVDQHDRAHGPAPLRRHAVAGQVARHDVDQAGHRRGAREPQDQDAADVVDGAEALAELLVRQVGQGPAVRRAARLELAPPGSARW